MPSRIFCLRLLAEALQLGDLAGLARGLQLVDGVDAEFVVQRLHLLRPDAGQPEHLEQTRRDRRSEVVQERQLARW